MQHPLADYASPDICRIWTPEWNHTIERDWWVRILAWLVRNTRAYAHIEDIDGKVAAYRDVLIEDIDLDAIMLRELQTKHDVKARIEEFNHLATRRYATDVGHDVQPLELIHWAMTSADVVDNISLIKINSSMCLLWSLYGKDNGPAREIIDALNWLPLRGLQGPVGTQQDLLDLLEGDRYQINALNHHLAGHYGFGDRVLGSVGQVYPRSLDLMVGTKVAAAIAAYEHPIFPWYRILRGYLSMIAEYSGDQWNEGDVSTSAIRRVALPGMFLAADCAIRRVQP